MKKRQRIMENESYLLLVIILCRPWKVEANSCSNCISDTLGKESRNITFRPSDEHNCNCKWTILKSITTDDNTAVVLLLQNVSLPMTSGIGGSTDCSARIRFPGTDGFKCSFSTNYCIAYATSSTKCTIHDVTQRVSLLNHTCTSLTSWKKGEASYLLQYNAGNFAGYINYFTIYYITIDRTINTTTLRTTKHTDAYSTRETVENTTSFNERTVPNVTSFNSVARTGTQKSMETTETLNLTMLVIVVTLGAGLLVMLFVAILLIRNCKVKRIQSVKSQELNENKDIEKEVVENTIYGATANDHKSEMIINEIYDTTPVTEVTNVEQCLYAVVEKKTGERKQDQDKNGEPEENNVIIEDKSSSVYAIVNKEKK